MSTEDDSGPETGLDAVKAALASARAAARGYRVAGAQAQPRGARAIGASRDVRSGTGPDDRDPQPFAKAIDRLINQRGWEEPAAIGGVLGRWDEIVGADLAAHCKPLDCADGVVRVLADSTAWATQVRLLAGPLLRRLNEELGHGTVTRVIVQGPSGGSWKHGRLSARDGRGPRDTYG